MISDISGGEKNLGFRCIQLDYLKKLGNVVLHKNNLQIVLAGNVK